MGTSASGSEHLLSIRIDQWNGVARISVSGELDMSGRERFEQAFRTAEDYGKQGIRVDLSELAFMDSSALAVLLDARARAEQAERGLLLRWARGEVWKLLQVAGVHEAFPGADGTEFPASADEPAEWSPTPEAEPDKV